MRTLISASNPMPKYIYMPLPDGKADVFIYKLLSQEDENLIYETNEFRTSKINETDIASDPFSYLDYEEKEKSMEEKIVELEEKVKALTYELEKVTESAIEVIKKEDSELPYGDYANPVQYIKGDEIKEGIFYWFNDYDIRQEAIKDGIPNSFYDENYFDVI